MRHRASRRFWAHYRKLPLEARKVADRAFQQLLQDPAHPSLHFKRIGSYRSVRVGLHYRALAIETEGGVVWFWIGLHSEYDRLL